MSFQLFSSREAESFDEQLMLLKELGYTDVQPFFFGPPEDMAEVAQAAQAIRDHGLTAKTGHFTLDIFDTDPDLVERIAKLYGMWLVVVPYINPEDRPTTSQGWRALGERLAAHTEDMKARGLTFAYHNHEFEMVPLEDGSYPIEHLLGESVPFEPDLAWMVVGGADPMAWIKRYAGRIPAVHVKDIAPEGEALDEKGFADFGSGVMDWQPLWEACVAAGSQLMIVEHDQPSDWRRFATRSAHGLKRIAEGVHA
ncbi:sugar phosphate isomerase/epimerase [Thioclava sp. CPCC 100088]|uniref:Sugar phosphate isomerase/epimerase n=2 Tax=Thioclava kandeliae TaxID=3070818 RepID=A0ABV1SFQ2_9RHOB